MNRKKIWLLMVLALALCVSMCVVAHAEEGGNISVPIGAPQQMTVDGGGEFYYTVGGSMSVVNVKVTASVPLLVFDNVSGSDVTYAGKAFPHDYSFTNVVGAGDHWFALANLNGYQPFDCVITVTVLPFTIDERESNDYWDDGWNEATGEPIINSNVLALTEAPLNGVIFSADGESDYDWYKFTLDSARTVDISLRQHDRPFGWDLLSSNGNWIDNDWVDGSTPLVKPTTSTQRFQLPAGTYFYSVFSGNSYNTGRYDISIKLGAGIEPKPVVPKSLTVTTGFALVWWDLYTTPPFPDTVEYEVTLSSNKPSVLAVDPDYPVLATGVKPGKATLTLKLLDKTYQIKVTVAKNEFKRSKPKKPGKAQAGIFTSLKKASYDANGNLVVDIFVYNKSGKLLKGIDRPTVWIGWNAYTKFYLIDWEPITFKKPIKNNTYGVYSLKIAPERLPIRNMDLRAGIEIGISDNASAKRVTFVNGSAKGVVSVNAPEN